MNRMSFLSEQIVFNYHQVLFTNNKAKAPRLMWTKPLQLCVLWLFVFIHVLRKWSNLTRRQRINYNTFSVCHVQFGRIMDAFELVAVRPCRLNWSGTSITENTQQSFCLCFFRNTEKNEKAVLESSCTATKHLDLIALLVSAAPLSICMSGKGYVELHKY